MHSYSQNMEDLMLYRLLRNKEKGFYIDIGAHDPDELSVTKLFYEKGWSGINVEPVAASFKKIEKARERDINIHAVISDIEGYSYFYEITGSKNSYDFDPSALSSLDQEVVTEACKKFNLDYDIIRIKSYRLETICKKYCIDTEIDFMKIDVEGLELTVLQSGNFRKYRPKILVIEATKPNCNIFETGNPNDQGVWDTFEPFLFSVDYEFGYFDGLNRFYLAKEHQHLQPLFSVPIGIYDGLHLPALQSAHKNLSYQKGQLLAENEMLKTQVADLTAAEADCIQLKAQLSASEQARAAVEDKLTVAEADCVQLKAQLSASEQARAAAEDKLTAAEADCAQLNVQLTTTETALSQSNGLVKENGELFLSLLNKNNSLATLLKNNIDSIHNFTENLDLIEKEISYYIDQYNILSMKFNEEKYDAGTRHFKYFLSILKNNKNEIKYNTSIRNTYKKSSLFYIKELYKKIYNNSILCCNLCDEIQKKFNNFKYHIPNTNDIEKNYIQKKSENNFSKWSKSKYVNDSIHYLIQWSEPEQRLHALDMAYQTDMPRKKLIFPHSPIPEKWIKEKENLEKQFLYFNFMSESVENVTISDTNEAIKLCNGNIVFAYYNEEKIGLCLKSCLETATPLLVNRTPKVENILGDGYPLYYYSFLDACERIKNKETILQAHLYLQNKYTSESKVADQVTATPEKNQDFLDAAKKFPINNGNLVEFAYAKKSHHTLLKQYICPFLSPHACPLKAYQDAFTLAYLLNTLPQDARILEIGGGFSRVLDVLSKHYECWNLDKFEGTGNGPTSIPVDVGYRIILDYIGAFNQDLPENTFDCVFSISVMEHLPEENPTVLAVYDDINRLLKPNGVSFHVIDTFAVSDTRFHSFIRELSHLKFPVISPEPNLTTMLADPDLWIMPQKDYDINWKPITKLPYEKFLPTSVTVAWRKES